MFNHTQFTTVTIDALWHAVACDLACLYSFFHQYLVKHNKGYSSFDLGNILYKKFSLVIGIDV